MKALRPHQTELIARLREAIRGGSNRVMAAAPTGFGKTIVSAEIVKSALSRGPGRRVLFIVPAIALIDQTVNAFIAQGIPDADIGVIQGDHPRSDDRPPVQIASIQTLEKRRAIGHFDLVVVDEAHRWFKFMGEFMAAPGWETVPFVGLSATPWSRNLGRHYQALVSVTTTADLIERGFLSRYRVFAPSSPDLSGVRIKAGDFHEGDLSKAADKPDLVADVVDQWLRRGEGRPTFLFAVDRPHAKNLAKAFEGASVPVAYIDAYTKPAEREEIFVQFRAGNVKVICSVGCLTTGVDEDVRAIILCRPTRSEILYVQMLGRGLRTAPGKEDLIVLDHSDTTQRLGFVDSIHYDKLDCGEGRGKADRKEKDEPLPKACDKCAFVRPPRVATCPSCGFRAERQTDLTCADGDLVELTRADAARANAQAKADLAEQRSILGQLQSCAALRGHSRGWVAHKYKSWFGEWPDAHRNVPDVEPSARVLSWIKAGNIRWAKGRGKAQGFRAPSASASAIGGRNAAAV